jgi:aspartyl-tRNA(Asn)/glutamyl-tRNA(Gln) amidotransferase subunit A
LLLFEFFSIEQYHAQLREGTVTCRQAVEHFLHKINSARHLNAFIDVYGDEALRKADELDRRRIAGNEIGSLHGVIIALKDIIAYKGHRLTAASKILEGFTSLFSSTATERLLEQEAIIIGDCNCDEFAMGSTNENSAYGNVLNAADENRIPGGSSGGSAVAVQAGMCMVSLGSDTGGSVRQPADFCGVVGIKPTYGRVSRHGLIAYASSFDQIGIFGNNVNDVAKVLQVISGPDPYDATVSTTSCDDLISDLADDNNMTYRFAYFNEALRHPQLDKEIAAAIKATIEKLKDDGHRVEPVHFEYLDYVVPAYYILTTAEASSNLARYDGIRYGFKPEKNVSEVTELYKLIRSEGFGKEVKRRIMLGTFVLSTGYYDAYFTKAQQVRQLVVQRTKDIFSQYDFILMPTSPTPAFRIGEKMNDPVAMYLADIFTVMANLVGCPAISIPLYKHSSGMPFGLQVMSQNFNEVPLLQVARRLMESQYNATSAINQ